jgi:16S rRNA (guanine966-N2)-methyltransferase
MRIIAGRAGGITLKVPPVVARPTADRVREALFSMLSDVLEDARVLDVFAGSGALGLESLSRGANMATFVEQNAGACAVIEENLKKSRLAGGKVLKGEALSTLKRLAQNGERFDIVFADPPYCKKPGDTDFGQQLLLLEPLKGLLGAQGFFVLETMMTKDADAAIANWEVVRDRAYGSTRILILKPLLTDAQSASATDL